jgi:hypothetical protein
MVVSSGSFAARSYSLTSLPRSGSYCGRSFFASSQRSAGRGPFSAVAMLLACGLRYLGGRWRRDTG